PYIDDDVVLIWRHRRQDREGDDVVLIWRHNDVEISQKTSNINE
ncbi:hypothetical protein A2U01_0073210, partial [Trifolium medium]|nr:hypothetical protein [Trifolium medium]